MKSLLLLFALAFGCHPPVSKSPDSDTEMAQLVLDSTVLVDVGGGHGSGFFVDEDTVVTAAHVLAMASWPALSVTTRDGQRCTVLRGVLSTTHDFALIDVADCKAPALPIGDPPLEGQRVWLTGAPYGLSWSVTTGIVSDADEGEVYVLDAHAYPGMSGGPVVDSRGHLIGLVRSGLPSRFGWRTEIVPAKHLRPYLD